MKKRIVVFSALLVLLMPSCDVLRQIEEMKMLSKCEFRINTVSDIHLAGINVSRIQNFSDVRPLDVLQLTNAFINNKLDFQFMLNLEVNNPNEQAASLNRLEWILYIDDMQMIEGAVTERFTTGPGQTSLLPVQIGFNLSEILKDERRDKVLDFGFGLADGSGKTTRVMVKLKPSIMVGQRSIMYPGWIEVRNEFTAN
jgi:hypothetical protein